MAVLWPGPRFEERIAQLRQLDAGWGFEDDNRPIAEEIFTNMYSLLNQLKELTPFPNPAVGVTGEGEIALFWLNDGYSVTVSHDNKVVIFKYDNNSSMEIIHSTIEAAAQQLWTVFSSTAIEKLT